MLNIIVGSILLSLIHALIPNHWIPLIAIGKSEKWTKKEVTFSAFFTGISHTLSTVIIGIIIGITGYKLSKNYELISSTIAPVVLIVIGIIYFLRDFIWHHHEHTHSSQIKNRSKWAILIALSIEMFFSPCLEIEAFFFQAGTYGWPGIITLSLIYTVFTVLLMMLYVNIGFRGIEKIKSGFIERHNKKITGIILIILGIISCL